MIDGGIEWPHEQDLSAETLFYRNLPIKPINRRGIRALADPPPKSPTLPTKHIIGLGALVSGMSNLGSNKEKLRNFGR